MRTEPGDDVDGLGADVLASFPALGRAQPGGPELGVGIGLEADRLGLVVALVELQPDRPVAVFVVASAGPGGRISTCLRLPERSVAVGGSGVAECVSE